MYFNLESGKKKVLQLVKDYSLDNMICYCRINVCSKVAKA